jgi:hypothetical protein
MSPLTYVLNLIMDRYPTFLLDGYSPILKLDASKIIMRLYFLNESVDCKMTDLEVTLVSESKWPNLKKLRLGRFLLN